MKHNAIIGPLAIVKAGVTPEVFAELRAQSQRCLIDFLDVEIKLGFTFVESAAYERDAGEAEHFQHTKQQAVKAVASIHHFVDRVENQVTRDAIASRCQELERAIAAL